MSYYHISRQEAEKAGEPYQDKWCVRAELVPYNGWVLVFSPKTLAYLKEPLEPMLAVGEVEILHRIRRRPEGHVTPPEQDLGDVSGRRAARRARRAARAVAAPPPPPPATGPVAPAVLPATVAPARVAPPPPPPAPPRNS